MEITAQDIKDMLQQLKKPIPYTEHTYILPKWVFDGCVKQGIFSSNTTLFVVSEHIPDNVMYKVPHRDNCIDRLLELSEEYRGLKRR